MFIAVAEGSRLYIGALGDVLNGEDKGDGWIWGPDGGGGNTGAVGGG